MPKTLRTTGWQPTHREDPEGAGWRKTATIGTVGGNVDPKMPHNVPPHVDGGSGGVATAFSRTNPEQRARTSQARTPAAAPAQEGWIDQNTYQHAPGWSPNNSGGGGRQISGGGGSGWQASGGGSIRTWSDVVNRAADAGQERRNLTARGQDLTHAQHQDKMGLDWDKHDVQQDQWGKQHRLDWAEQGSTASKNKALSNYYDVMGQIGQSAERRLAASQEFDQQQTRDAPINAMLQTMLAEGMFPGSKKVSSEQAGQLSKVFADLMKGGYNQDTPLAELGDRMEEIFEAAQELFGHPGAEPQSQPTIEMPELLEILTAEDGRSKIEMLRKHMETRAQQQEEQQATAQQTSAWAAGQASRATSQFDREREMRAGTGSFAAAPLSPGDERKQAKQAEREAARRRGVWGAETQNTPWPGY